jgi:hypothetical protein
LNRCKFEIQINNKVVNIDHDLNFATSGWKSDFINAFNIILENIENQSQLSNQDSLHVMKQFSLGIHWQSEKVDIQNLIALLIIEMPPLPESATHSSVSIKDEVTKYYLKSHPKCLIEFIQESNWWLLQSKTDSTSIPG